MRDYAGLTPDLDGIVIIGSDIYCLTPAAQLTLTDWAAAEGYQPSASQLQLDRNWTAAERSGQPDLLLALPKCQLCGHCGARSQVIVHNGVSSCWQCLKPAVTERSSGQVSLLHDGYVHRLRARLPDYLTVPPVIKVYHTWHWGPLMARPELWSRIVMACDGSLDPDEYQVTEQRFGEPDIRQMGRFVRHCTTFRPHSWKACAETLAERYGADQLRALRDWCQMAAAPLDGLG